MPVPQQALQAPCVINDHRIEVHASIGVGCAPQDADNAEDLLKVADMALYAAKAAGRDQPVAPKKKEAPKGS